MLKRRGFLLGLTGVVCAPAIVRASSLMAVRPWTDGGLWFLSSARPVGDSSANVADLRYMPDDVSPNDLAATTIDFDKWMLVNPGWWKVHGA